MKEKRRDSKERILHTGESQRTDGKYLYKYVDAFGNTKYVYAWRLTPTDPTPKGKPVSYTHLDVYKRQDWASHKHNTNAGKTSEDGVWFGTSEPDDSKGALPYDTYIIEELKCESNKGFELIPPFEIVVSRNNLVIDLGTLTDEYEKEISIHTTATSKDGEKTILAGKEITIVDTVKLDGLTKGTKYQLKGWQMLKEENAELIIDGKRVENDYTFVADEEEMKVEI